jgi:hypothetical protein
MRQWALVCAATARRRIRRARRRRTYANKDAWRVHGRCNITGSSQAATRATASPQHTPCRRACTLCHADVQRAHRQAARRGTQLHGHKEHVRPQLRSRRRASACSCTWRERGERVRRRRWQRRQRQRHGKGRDARLTAGRAERREAQTAHGACARRQSSAGLCTQRKNARQNRTAACVGVAADAGSERMRTAGSPTDSHDVRTAQRAAAACLAAEHTVTGGTRTAAALLPASPSARRPARFCSRAGR